MSFNIGDEVAPRISPNKHGKIVGIVVQYDDNKKQTFNSQNNLIPWVAPTPTPTPTPSPTPNPSWSGDLHTGDWSTTPTYGWDGSPIYHLDGRPQDFAIVTTPVPPDLAYAYRVTLTPQSTTGAAGQRGLLTLWPNGTSGKTHAYQGAEAWYRERVYFPSDFVAAPDTDWNWLYELHNSPDGHADAQLALSVVMDTSDGGGSSNGERLSCRIMGGGSSAHPADNYGSGNIATNPDVRRHWFIGPKIQRGHWYDLVWHVRWDWKLGGSGLVEQWIDDVKYGSYSGPTLYYYKSLGGPGEAYLQAGYYRDNDAAHPNSTVYHAGTLIGPTAASIGKNY